MEWYERHKRLEKVARRFQLGSSIENEIKDIVSQIYQAFYQSWAEAARKKPNQKLITEQIFLLMDLEEFKSINRIDDDRLPDVLSEGIYLVIQYTPDEKDENFDGQYNYKLDRIEQNLFFNNNSLSNKSVFTEQMTSTIYNTLRHEALHALEHHGDLTRTTEYYAPPENEPTIEEQSKYMYQAIEQEPQMSDFHNYLLTDLRKAVANMVNALNMVLIAHKLPDGERKKKIFSRLYTTVQEMDGFYQNEPRQDIVMAVKEVLYHAFKNDENNINNSLQKLKEAL